MNRARVRRLAATVIVGSLLAVQAFAGTATAAVPEANYPGEAIPATYDPGEAAGFRGFFQLKPTESGTLAKLFLRIDVDEALATNVYYSVKKNGAAVPAKACKLDAPANPQDVVCEIKTVRPTDLIVATAGYLAADTLAQTSARFVWSSVGTPQNEDQSHGDSWVGALLVANESDGSNPNYGGGFTYGGDTSVQNAPIGPDNLQSTKLVGLPVGVAATVLDGLAQPPRGTCTTTPEIDCDELFGEWVEVNVGDGLTYPLFEIQITYASGTPKGFVHLFVVNGVELQESVDACAKKVADREYPCFTWKASTNTASIFTTYNGVYKGR